MRLFRLSLCRWVMYMAAGFAVVELLILNVVIMYIFWSLKQEFDGFKRSSDLPLVDRLLERPLFGDLVYRGKNGGFISLLQHTLERIYIVTEPSISSKEASLTDFTNSQISHLGLDVSGSGEALYLYKRIQSRGKQFTDHYKLLVVDIGANDGLMSSNSFNFIQLGWNAILVEPQKNELQTAKANIERYVDPYNEKKQTATLVNCIIGDHDGMEDFVLKASSLGMESHVYDPHKMSTEEQGVYHSSQRIIKVQSMTVATFAAKYNIPENLGILSIDAEGVGDRILHQWIDSGFRPAYIVYEQLHNKEPLTYTAKYLQDKKYRFLTQRGWNYIFEHTLHFED